MEKNTKKAKKARKKPVTIREGKNGGKLNSGGVFENMGRPLGSQNRKNIIQELLDMDAPESLLAEVRKLNPSAKTLRDIHTVSTFNRSLKGNPKAMEMMMYYDIGKPKEVHEVEMIDKTRPLTKEELKEKVEKMGLNIKLFDK